MKFPLERPHVHMGVLKMLSSAFLRCLQLSSFAARGAAAFNKIPSCLTGYRVSNLILCLHQTGYSYRGNAVTSKPQCRICSFFSQAVLISHTSKKSPVAAFTSITAFTLKFVLAAVDWWEERERKGIFCIPNSFIISQYKIRLGHVIDLCNTGHPRADGGQIEAGCPFWARGRASQKKGEQKLTRG